MKQWLTLFKKEWREHQRNFKLLWLPLVFLVLGIMDPLASHFLPLLIDTVGGLPDGAIFEMPVPSAPEVVMMTLGQLSSLGILVIILAAMGTIANEKQSGIADLILVKPVSAFHYVTTKWAGYVLLALGTLSIALLLNWYYVTLLFGSIPLRVMVLTFLFYSLWFMFVITLVIFYSSLLASQLGIAAATIGSLLLLTGATTLFTGYLTWRPSQLSTHIASLLLVEQVPTDLVMTALITLGVSAGLLVGAALLFKRRHLTT